MRNRHYFILFLLVFLSFDVFGQDLGLVDFNEQRLHIQKVGMMTLGGWALGNMAVNGALLIKPSSNEQGHFYRMNIFWNVVNLGLAIPGLRSAMITDPSSLSLVESIGEFNQMSNLLMINAGLDVAYIAGGFLMKEMAKTRPNKQDILKGYGRSLILQGGFLLAFDIILYTFLQTQDPSLNDLLSVVSFKGSSVVLTFKF